MIFARGVFQRRGRAAARLFSRPKHYVTGQENNRAAIEHYEKVAEVDYGFLDVAKRLDALSMDEGGGDASSMPE